MFTQIAIGITIGRDSYTYTRGQQAVWLMCGVFGHDGEDVDVHVFPPSRRRPLARRPADGDSVWVSNQVQAA